MVCLRAVVLFFCTLLLSACSPRASLPAIQRTVPLPPPRTAGPVSLEQALAQRRSVRSYAPRPLSWSEVSQLLWAAQGITDPRGFRTAPSAGALYPLEVYLALPQGWYHYRPQGHLLEQLGDEDLRPQLWEAGLRQDALREAPAVLVLVAVPARTEAKYGARALRYVQLEAGHAAQNLLLQATALGLGAVPIGAFDDEGVRRALRLSADTLPLYLIPVGEPTGR